VREFFVFSLGQGAAYYLAQGPKATLARVRVVQCTITTIVHRASSPERFYTYIVIHVVIADKSQESSGHCHKQLRFWAIVGRRSPETEV